MEQGRLIDEKLRVIFADHGGAGGRRRDDSGAGFKDIDHVAGKLAGLFVKAVVELGLTATGLIGGKIDPTAEVLEESNQGYRGIRKVSVG